MKASPLTLKDIAFMRLSVEIDHNFKSRARSYDFADTEYRLSIRYGKAKDDDAAWWVGVEYGTRSTENKTCPYDLDILAVGLFSVADEFPSDRAEKLVYENGAALVFSAIREMVSTVTGRFTYGPLILPTVSFMGEYEKHLEKKSTKQADTEIEQQLTTTGESP